MQLKKPNFTGRKAMLALAAMILSCQQFVVAPSASAAPPCSRLREYRIFQLQGGKELPAMQYPGDTFDPQSHAMKHLKKNIASAFSYAAKIRDEAGREHPRKSVVQENLNGLRLWIHDIRLDTNKDLDPKRTNDVAAKSWLELRGIFNQLAVAVDTSLQGELDKKDCNWLRIYELSGAMSFIIEDGTGDLMNSVERNESSTSR